MLIRVPWVTYTYSVDVVEGVGATDVGFGAGVVGFGPGVSPRQRRHASPVSPVQDVVVLAGVGFVLWQLRHASPVRPEHEGAGVHSLTEPGNRPMQRFQPLPVRPLQLLP
jgi:hypothetical protein